MDKQTFLKVPVRKSQICKLLENTAKLCLKTVKEFFKLFCIIYDYDSYEYKFKLEHFYMVYLKGEKVCICGLAEVLNPQTKKRLAPQIANPQSVTFAEGAQVLQII